MSMPMNVREKCFVCGEESEQTVLLSTNAFGAPDLDWRPPEMQRSTMCWWLQECPHCGYVASSLEQSTNIDRAFLQREEYLSCSNISFASDLAKSFYRKYLIALEENNWDGAFYSALYAAWACDDMGDTQNAVTCRKLALVQLDRLQSACYDPERQVQRADLLRRAGMFDAVLDGYNAADFADETLQKIVQFQIQKAKEKDVGVYTVANAVE